MRHIGNKTALHAKRVFDAIEQPVDGSHHARQFVVLIVLLQAAAQI